MSLEAFTGWIKDLVSTNPTGTDGKSQGDDHIRGLKLSLKQTFAGLNQGKAITVNEDQINAIVNMLDKTLGGQISGQVIVYFAPPSNAWYDAPLVIRSPAGAPALSMFHEQLSTAGSLALEGDTWKFRDVYAAGLMALQAAQLAANTPAGQQSNVFCGTVGGRGIGFQRNDVTRDGIYHANNAGAFEGWAFTIDCDAVGNALYVQLGLVGKPLQSEGAAPAAGANDKQLALCSWVQGEINSQHGLVHNSGAINGIGAQVLVATLAAQGRGNVFATGVVSAGNSGGNPVPAYLTVYLKSQLDSRILASNEAHCTLAPGYFGSVIVKCAFTTTEPVFAQLYLRSDGVTPISLPDQYGSLEISS